MSRFARSTTLTVVLAALFLLGFSTTLRARQATQVIVTVRFESKPVAGAEVGVGDNRAKTSASGEATVDVPAGTYNVTVSSPAHLPFTTRVEVAAGAVARVTADLEPLPEIEDEIEVSATRSTKIGRAHV